ncbi:MAG: VWA domain-containing protein [Oscillospiraceae bacterium]|jgi:hypothetical protein|nr:VWA domain-containing protein [Oscillospiraceae bacterium]
MVRNKKGLKPQSHKIIIAIISLFVFVGLLFLSPLSLAAPESIRIEQVQIEKPDVHAWIAADDGDFNGAGLSARLDNSPLTLAELRQFDPAIDATAYYFIVDCSRSVRTAHMNATKRALIGVAENMGPNDTFTLITFGVEVNMTLNRETDIEKISIAINELVADQRGTLFFESLALAQELASNSNHALERKLAFVFTDSDDYAVGSTTKDEVERLIETGNLPFYAIGFDNGSREGLDYFGTFARTSGGVIRIVSAQTLNAAFDEMIEMVNNTWLARFKAESNIISASSKEFILTVDSSGATAVRLVPVLFWQPDNDAPEITSFEQLTPESIRLHFNKPVEGASIIDSYIVKDSEGNVLGISAVAYDESDSSVVLTFSAPPLSGILTVECPGLTDISMERNRVTSNVSIDFSGTDPVEPTPVPPTPEPPPPPPEPETTPIAAWIFICVLAAVIITAVAVSLIRKSNKSPVTVFNDSSAELLNIKQSGKAANDMQIHFVSGHPEPKQIKLNVTDASGKSHIVEIPINKTLFVGRSDICDVFFDDNTMSRQHFVIGEENDVFSITNLSESGNTFLNGVPIKNPRPIQNGDTIKAGQQTIVFLCKGN